MLELIDVCKEYDGKPLLTKCEFSGEFARDHLPARSFWQRKEHLVADDRRD